MAVMKGNETFICEDCGKEIDYQLINVFTGKKANLCLKCACPNDDNPGFLDDKIKTAGEEK